MPSRKTYLCLYKTFAALNGNEYWNVNNTNDILKMHQCLNVLPWTEMNVYPCCEASLRRNDYDEENTLLWTILNCLNFFAHTGTFGYLRGTQVPVIYICILDITKGTVRQNSTSWISSLEFLHTPHFAIFLQSTKMNNFITQSLPLFY